MSPVFIPLEEWSGRSIGKASTVRVSMSLNDAQSVDGHLVQRAVADSLVCFLPAAQRHEVQRRNPVFHRGTWHEDLPESHVLTVSDPALYLDDEILACWFVDPNLDVIRAVSDFIVRVAERLGVPRNRIILHGSSMGGFGALGIASCIGESLAIAEIPQLDLQRWPVPSALAAIEQRILGGMTLDDFRGVWPERIDILSRFVSSGVVPSFWLIVNRGDKIFPEQLEFMGELSLISKRVHAIGEQKLWVQPDVHGHGPLSRSRAVEIIRQAITMAPQRRLHKLQDPK